MDYIKKLKGTEVSTEREGAPVSRPQAATRSKGPQAQRSQDLASILVLGRCGSGKTQLIHRVCECCATSRSRNEIATQEPVNPVSHRLILSNGSIVKLIDTPGLDNLNLTDLNIFAKIAEYLRDPTRIDRGVTRIIYVHPAGDTLHSRTLQQNLRTILDLFVNQTDRMRLTILVASDGAQGVDPQVIIDTIRHSNLGIFKEVARRGASIKATPSDPEGFADLLRSYALQPPVFPPIFLVRRDEHHPGIESRIQIETSLGYCDKRTVDLRILSYEKKLESYEKQMRELHANTISCQQSYEQLKLRHTEQRKTEADLRQQLQEVKNDYGFLRSQVQAQDNHDQEGIAEGLVNLNKDIGDIGQSIAEHITDNHIGDTFDQDPSKISASDAKDLTQLKLKLGHCEGKSSLVESLDGKSLLIEEFFDFATRTLLCTFLVEKIFRPFHPYLDLTSHELVGVHNAFAECYCDVQKLEPQYMAGKWRSIAFRSIDNMKRKSSQPKIDAENLTQDFLNNCLYSLLGAFFGQKHGDFSLDKQLFSRLHRLIQMSLEWNSKLKGEVITLGDYTQTIYPVGTEYNTEHMQELEVDSGSNIGQRKPRFILGTLALGLICYKATGQGQPPVKTVLEKALVATESLYI